MTKLCSAKAIYLTSFFMIIPIGSGCEEGEEKVEVNTGEINYCQAVDGENPCWFREIEVGEWTVLTGDDSGILSVKQKLEGLYGQNASTTKVDLANDEFSEGNWEFEFAQLAEKSVHDGDYLAATGYFTIAASPLLYGDNLAPMFYNYALDAFKVALDNGHYPFRVIKVNVDGAEIEAYLVYPQSMQTGDKVPVVLQTGGIDHLLTQMFDAYLLHWNQHKIAWVGFDIPGMGTARGLRMTGENIDRVHRAVIAALKQDINIDSRNIFVYGRSMGGYAALHLLAVHGNDKDLDLAGIAAAGALGDPTFESEDVLDEMPASLRNCWGARLGIDPEDSASLWEASPQFRYSAWTTWPPKGAVTDVPFLLYNGDDDPFGTVEEMALPTTTRCGWD